MASTSDLMAMDMDPERESARPQSTAIAALGALTTELVAARETLEHLPTREEVERRLAEEREGRQRAFRWLGAAVLLLLLSSGIGLSQFFTHKNQASETRRLAGDTKHIVVDVRDLIRKVDCVVAAAAATELGSAEQQKAYAECIAVAADAAESNQGGD